MSFSKSDVTFILALSAVVYALAFQLWLTLRSRPKTPQRRPVSVRTARFYAAELRKIARAERIRAWKDAGRDSEQAAWLCAKAEYALYASGADSKKPLDVKGRLLLEDMYRLLTVSCEQSRHGVQDIPEEDGARLRAYIDPLDQSLQTYSVSLPRPYYPGRAYPLLICLHGHGWYRPFQGHPAPSCRGAITLSPHGRGATDYKALGERDVLLAIAEVKRHFNVDENRVYIMGTSMGGTGAFHLGTHFADQFAGILPICGNADNAAWTHAWGWNRIFEGRNNAMRNWLQDSNTARAFAQNLMNLPTFIICGTGDTVVPPEHSRNMAKLLRGYGAPVQFREYPDCGHGGFPKESVQDALSWVFSHERNPYPKNIYWKADSPRYGKAYWTRMEQFEKPLTSAYLYTSVKDGGVTFRTANLLSFSFQRPEALFLRTSSLAVTVDGNAVQLRELPQEPDAWITLRKDPVHGWRDARELPAPGLIKKAGLDGPISAALEAPFVLVVGTSAQDEAMNAAWKREAQTFVSEWKRRNNAPCLVVTDRECTLDIIQERNLILFGDGRDNAVSDMLSKSLPVADMLSNLPIKEQAPEVSLTGPLDAPDLGYMLVYPNVELAPNRLVVMLAANSPQGAFQMWGRFGNWFNWGVFDSKKYFDYACFDARSATPESMLTVGWFGTDWRVESGKYFLGDDKIREAMPPQRYPALQEIPRGRDTLMLAELMPARISQMRGALGIGRGFFGEELEAPESLGMRAPCILEYDIQGVFRRFSSDVALLNPQETNLCPERLLGEQVTFSVYGDGRLLASASVTWDKPRLHIDANLQGVKKLRLEASCTKGPAWLHAGSAWLGPALFQ